MSRLTRLICRCNSTATCVTMDAAVSKADTCSTQTKLCIGSVSIFKVPYQIKIYFKRFPKVPINTIVSGLFF